MNRANRTLAPLGDIKAKWGNDHGPGRTVHPLPAGRAPYSPKSGINHGMAHCLVRGLPARLYREHLHSLLHCLGNSKMESEAAHGFQRFYVA